MVRSCSVHHCWYPHRRYFPDTTSVPETDEDGFSAPEPCGKYETDFVDSKRLRIRHSFDVKQYLFPCSEKDYLIRRKVGASEERLGAAEYLEGKKYVVICNFYIPVMKDDNVASTCRDLEYVFNELVTEEKHDDFGVVLVTRMRSDFPNYDNHHVAMSAFNHFFSAFSSLFVAVPILDLKRSRDLFEITCTSFYDSPGCVVADLVNQQVSHIGFFHFNKHGADFYPFTSENLEEVNEQKYAMRCGKVPLSTFLRHQSSDVLHCEAHFAEFTSSCGKKESLSSISNKVVWLYYLRDGSFMDQLLDLYKKCKADEEKSDFEIVVVRSRQYLVSGEKRVHVDSLLKHSDCCGWLHLPFDDRVDRRMHNLCNYHFQDKLVVVGPNTSYADQDGKEVFREFGIDAYPFTKQTVWDNEVKRLRRVTLTLWLIFSQINFLMKSNGEIFPVTKLVGVNVLIIFCTTCDSKFCLDWDGGNVVEWVNEMKTASKARFEVIFLCSSLLNEDGLKEMNELCTNNGWLRPDPHDHDCNATLHHMIFGRLLFFRSGLVAFGPKGNLLRLCLQYDLQRDSGPATFPESDEDDLASDVGVHLNSRSDDAWRGALRFSGWRGDLM